MNIDNLRSIISSLSETLRVAGANASAADINRIKAALPDDGDENALAALEAIEHNLKHERDNIRHAYILDLNASGTNKNQFRLIFDRLSIDKLMDKDDVSIIATSYIGAGRKWRSKAAAMQSVQEKFNERAYLESKMRLLETAHGR